MQLQTMVCLPVNIIAVGFAETLSLQDYIYYLVNKYNLYFYVHKFLFIKGSDGIGRHE